MSDSGFLMTTSYNGAIGGLNMATLGPVAIVNSFVPAVIPVTQVSGVTQVTKPVTINYSVIPPNASLTSASVHIDQLGGSRLATLNGPLNQSTGQVTWPGGTVDPTKTYQVTVHVQSPAGELRAIPKRFPLVQFPVVTIPLDAMVRFQVMLPVDNNGNPIAGYTINVFQGTSANGTPAITIKSTDILNAFNDTSNWFTDPATGQQIQDGSGSSSILIGDEIEGDFVVGGTDWYDAKLGNGNFDPAGPPKVAKPLRMA